MKTKLTREQIEQTVKAGDIILVHYLKGGVVAAGIQFASGGKASHALCCLGGMEIIEADIGGVMHTFLDNYLTGKCRLTVKRITPSLNPAELAETLGFWRSKVSDPYDYGMIAHVAATWPVRHLILPVCPPLGRLILRGLSRISVASTKLSTCAELCARGLRAGRAKFLSEWSQEDITPEVLLRNARSLQTIAVWDAPVLVASQWEKGL